MEKKLGKIVNVRYGMGGYQDAQFGLSLTFEMRGGEGVTGVSTFHGNWATFPKSAQYSEEEWGRKHLETTLFVMETMRKAKVEDVSRLMGVPVEVTIEGNTLREWRILEEVL